MTPVLFFDKLSLLVEAATHPYGTSFAIGHGRDTFDNVVYWRCAAHIPPVGRHDDPGAEELQCLLRRGLWLRPMDRDRGDDCCVICEALGQ